MTHTHTVVILYNCVLLVVDNDIPTSDSRLLPCEENLIHRLQELFNLLCYVIVNNTSCHALLYSL